MATPPFVFSQDNGCDGRSSYVWTACISKCGHQHVTSTEYTAISPEHGHGVRYVQLRRATVSTMDMAKIFI